LPESRLLCNCEKGNKRKAPFSEGRSRFFSKQMTADRLHDCYQLDVTKFRYLLAVDEIVITVNDKSELVLFVAHALVLLFYSADSLALNCSKLMI